jgi:predicted RNase H-like HicB family nuclease
MAMQELNLHVDVRFESGDEIYIAEVRELEGCIAFGRTEAELREKLQVAIADYLELVEDADEVTFVSGKTTAPPLAQVGRSEVQVLAGAC